MSAQATVEESSPYQASQKVLDHKNKLSSKRGDHHERCMQTFSRKDKSTEDVGSAQDLPPFTNIGIDYFGLIQIRSVRSLLKHVVL